MANRRSGNDRREREKRRHRIVAVMQEKRSLPDRRLNIERRTQRDRRVFWDKRSPVPRRKINDRRKVSIPVIPDHRAGKARRQQFDRRQSRRRVNKL